MTPEQIAESMYGEVVPGDAEIGGLLRAGEYAAVVLDTMEYAATHQVTVRPELLDAVQAAFDSGAFRDGAFDDVDARCLAADIAAMR